MSNREQQKKVVLDTSFLIRLLKEDDPLHIQAKSYFQFFLENEYVLYVSTIVIAEYCVYGRRDDLPFECVRILPFNLDHAELTGQYARTLFNAQGKGEYTPERRLVIPNDTKIFAQASSLGALFFVTADAKASKAIEHLKNAHAFSVEHVDIHNSIPETFGTLF